MTAQLTPNENVTTRSKGKQSFGNVVKLINSRRADDN